MLFFALGVPDRRAVGLVAGFATPGSRGQRAGRDVMRNTREAAGAAAGGAGAGLIRVHDDADGRA